jgi:lipopolysaccharide export system protein LptC
MQNPRLTAPDFSGVTEDGAALSLKAAEVQLDNAESAIPGEVRLLYGSVATPDGGKTEFSAGQAHLDTAAQILSLGDGVKLTNSLGYQIATQGLSVALDRTHLTSDGPITAEAPAFTLSAGGMELRLADPEGPSYLLVFKSGVRMVYRPGIQGSDE